MGAFADYEQLVGGVETLFKDSSSIVKEYADNAYKTAGLSANEYMESVTGFSASLLSSMGGDTKAAAGLANQAITDMSDNANKMGSDMESIQNAYQGFAKQNYTMLDNLKLGYGGTQGEMKRLIKDAAKIDKSVDANSTSYANIIKAIHAIQENLNITGTTSKEASSTIQGSFAALKSSWGNLMTSLVTGGESFDRCMENIVDSAKTFWGNLKPAIEGALEGVGYLIDGLAPVIETELPGLIDSVLPPLIKAATAVVSGLIKALPSIAKTVIREIPNISRQIIQALGEDIGKELPTVGGVIEKFAGRADIVPKIAGILIGGIGVAKLLKPVVSGIFGKATQTAGAAGEAAAPSLGIFGSIGKIPITAVLTGIGNTALILGGITAIVTAFGVLSKIPHFSDFIKSGGDTLALLFRQIGKIGGAFIGGIGEGFTSVLPQIGANLTAFAQALKHMFGIFGSADLSGIGGFFGSLGGFMASMAAEGIVSIFTGGLDLKGLGGELTAFITGARGFFEAAAQLPPGGFVNAGLLFKSLADIGNVPNTGGIAQWFSGKNDYASLVQLYNLEVNGSIITYSGRNLLKNMMVQSFETTHPYTNSGGLDFSMELKEVRIAGNSYNSQADESKGKTRPETKAGTQQTDKGSGNAIYHAVQKGDTVFRLANTNFKELGTSVEWIMENNPHAFAVKGDPTTLQAGTRILVGYREKDTAEVTQYGVEAAYLYGEGESG